jgi:hypothetical protein
MPARQAYYEGSLEKRGQSLNSEPPAKLVEFGNHGPLGLVLELHA